MAILKFGPLVSGVRGSIGGLVFTNSIGGPCVRSSYRPTNPRSLLQSGQRGVFSTFPERWRQLSDAQREAWNNYAADPAQVLTNSLGEEYYASGFNWYCTINRANLVAGSSLLSSPPSDPVPSVPAITDVWVYVYNSKPFVELAFEDDPPMPDQLLVTFAAFSTGASRMVAHSGFYFIAVSDANSPPLLEIGNNMYARWPSCAVGDTFFLRFYAQNSEGRRSAPFESRNIYLAE